MELVSRKNVTGDCEIVYFSMRPIYYNGVLYISQLIAKLKGNTFFQWIKPPKSFVLPRGQNHGLKFQGSDVFRNNEKLPTVSLKITLKMFQAFLKTSPKPVLLVTYFGQADIRFFIETLKKTGTANLFFDLIAGFSDTLTIFAKKLLYIKGFKDLTISTLVKEVLNRDYTKPQHEAKYDLDILEKLVAGAIPKSELVLTSISYGKPITNDMRDPQTSTTLKRSIPMESGRVEKNFRGPANPGPSSFTQSNRAFQSLRDPQTSTTLKRSIPMESGRVEKNFRGPANPGPSSFTQSNGAFQSLRDPQTSTTLKRSIPMESGRVEKNFRGPANPGPSSFTQSNRAFQSLRDPQTSTTLKRSIPMESGRVEKNFRGPANPGPSSFTQSNGAFQSLRDPQTSTTLKRSIPMESGRVEKNFRGPANPGPSSFTQSNGASQQRYNSVRRTPAELISDIVSFLEESSSPDA